MPHHCHHYQITRSRGGASWDEVTVPIAVPAIMYIKGASAFGLMVERWRRFLLPTEQSLRGIILSPVLEIGLLCLYCEAYCCLIVYKQTHCELFQPMCGNSDFTSTSSCTVFYNDWLFKEDLSYLVEDWLRVTRALSTTGLWLMGKKNVPSMVILQDTISLDWWIHTFSLWEEPISKQNISFAESSIAISNLLSRERR